MSDIFSRFYSILFFLVHFCLFKSTREHPLGPEKVSTQFIPLITRCKSSIFSSKKINCSNWDNNVNNHTHNPVKTLFSFMAKLEDVRSCKIHGAIRNFRSCKP